MTANELIRNYPTLYHMAEDHTWPSIQKHGLLSTQALLDLLKIDGEVRREILSRHRPKSVALVNESGSITIRDQMPMRETSLRECLIEMTPTEWYELLNERVFLWATEKRVLTLLAARAYRERIHTVLTVDTASLIAKHEANICLSPINSGSTIYVPQPRGRDTFLPIGDYPFSERRKTRSVSNSLAEITVLNGIPDIAKFTTAVRRMKAGATVETLL